MSNSFRNRRSTSCQEENSSKSTCTGHVVLVFELMPKRMCYCSPVGVNENVQSSKGSSPFLPVSYPRDSTGNTHTQTYTVGQGISTSNAKEKSDPMYLVITTTSQKRHQLCVHSFEGRDAREERGPLGSVGLWQKGNSEVATRKWVTNCCPDLGWHVAGKQPRRPWELCSWLITMWMTAFLLSQATSCRNG